MSTGRSKLDLLRQAYKAAVDQWVSAIREEEARDKAKAAKEAYQDGLRLADYNI